MYDPSMRVLAVLELLQSYESISGTELARRLEVSPRSVQRYILRLQDLGIPVQGQRGVGGSYRLKAGFVLPPMMFSSEETFAVALGLQALQHLGLQELTPAAQTVHAKLQRVLPQTIREQIQTLEQSLQMEVAPWMVSTNVTILKTLLQAARANQVVQFAYINPKKADSIRRVQISHVLHWNERWYALGWCELREDTRVFRLDRIKDLLLLEMKFTPPAPFDGIAFLQSTMIEAPTTHQISVWLEFPPEILRSKISSWGTQIEAEIGGTRLRCERSNLEAFAAMLLGLGCMVRVEEPQALFEAWWKLQKRCAELIEYNEKEK
jgi:predicted DNA-binding transcriptional regulator YafY